MVRFLHLADKPFTEWKEEAGRVIPRSAKPNGFWMARDLTWVALMDKARQWTPRPDKDVPGGEPPGRILAAVSHAVDGTDLAVAAEGEAKPLPWTPLFVYVLEIPESSFSTDLAAPDRSRILRISRANLDALRADYTTFSHTWATTDAPSNPLVSDAIESLLRGPDKARAKALAKSVLKMEDPANYEILSKVASVGALVREVLEGRLQLPYSQTIIAAVAWRGYIATLRNRWGGMEFMPDLFTPEGDDPELVARVDLLRRLDVPSAVLFSPARVLGPDPPQTYLTAVLTGGGVPADVPVGVRVVRFGTTPAGELRVLPPSGGRRRRTRKLRRRVFQNPKTLKKRIR
jgi:hypothetical protein